MELFLVFSLIFLIIFPLVYLQVFANSRKGLPPGTFGLPIIGETIQFLEAFQNGKAHEFVNERKSKYHSQVVKTSFLGEKFVLLSGAEANKFIFTNEKKLVTGWRTSTLKKLLPSAHYVSADDVPMKLRSFIGLFFKSETIENLLFNLETVTQRHLMSFWRDKSEVKVYDQVKLFTFTSACRTMLSIEDPDLLSKLLHHFNFVAAGFIALDFNIPGTAFYLAKNASNELHKEIGSIIQQRRVVLSENLIAPPQDLLTHMLTVSSEDGNYVPELDIIDRILALLIGGYETSAATITFTMKYLAEKPQFYSEVIKEQMEIIEMMKPRDNLCWDDIKKMKKTWNFVNEVMRIVLTLQATFREVKTDFTYDGFLIPKGWKILLALGCTEMDPTYFPEPEKFDPSRFEENEIQSHTFIPFGGGPRLCPGKEYAKVTILIFLHYVLKMFRWEIMVPNERITRHIVPVPLEGFPVRLFPLQK